MPRVDFYLLDSADESERQLAACHLTQQLYQDQHRVFILVDAIQDLDIMNELLWTFDETSFVPHSVVDEQNAPVLLGSVIPKEQSDVLINLSREIPEAYQQFQIIIELVNQNRDLAEQKRQAYRFYREHACELNNQKFSLQVS